MSDASAPFAALLFLAFFVALWLTITVVLGAVAGWYELMRRFPDRPEAALALWGGQSGTMNGVAMRGILRLAVCRGGLRLGILRIFGPFSKDVFVPWESIAIERKKQLFWVRVTLSLGRPASTRLTLMARLADKMAQAAGARWPEGVAPPRGD